MLVASIPSKQHVHPGTKALPTYDGLAGLVAHLRESHIVEIRKYQQARVKGKCQASSVEKYPAWRFCSFFMYS